MPAVTVVLVAEALGVNPVAPAGVAVVFQPPVQVPIGRLFAPAVRLAGRVNEQRDASGRGLGDVEAARAGVSDQRRSC